MSKREQLEDARSEVESFSLGDVIDALKSAQEAKSRPKLLDTLTSFIEQLDTLQADVQEALDARNAEVGQLQEAVDKMEELKDSAQSVIDNLEE